MAISFACVGDGAGVGKGRTAAGIIFENYQKGRKKAIWLSVSNDLANAAADDIYDISAPHIKVYQLHKVNIYLYLHKKS